MAVENPLTQQYGALKGWQWVAIVGTLGAAYMYLHGRSTAPAPTGTTANTAAGVPPGRDILAPIIIQQGPPSQPPKPKPKPKPVKPPAQQPPPPKPKPKPQNPPAHTNARDYSQTIAANSVRGQNMTAVGQIKGGKYTGKNSSSGAPVYALIDTGYGPKTSFVQSWNASKLPEGTKIYTLAQFKNAFR